jgi:hypothetical protein
MTAYRSARIVKVLVAAAATIAIVRPAASAPARVAGMHVDLSDLDLVKSETLLRELRQTDPGLRIETDSSNRPTGTVITDPAGLRSALERLIAQRKIDVVDLEEFGQETDLSRLAGVFRDRAIVSQTAGPDSSASGIAGLYRSEMAACGADQSCRDAVGARFPGIDLVIQRLRAQSPACEQASLRYSAVLQGIADQGGAPTPTQANNLHLTGARLDDACLAAPWDADTPEVARAGGGNAAPGALNATALIEISGEDRPFCGGLFVSTREVLTTLHCFTGAEQYEALKDGRVVVRQMGTGEAAPAAVVAWGATPVSMPPPTLVGRLDIPVGEDMIRLRLADGPAAIPQVVTASPHGLANAFVAGYFQTRDTERRPAGSPTTWDASTPEWWKGVRWAKPGTCMVVDAADNCFRMMCQTTYGYSGTPVFATERDPSGALLLYGLVKGTEGRTNLCLPRPLQYSTLGIRSSSH